MPAGISADCSGETVRGQDVEVSVLDGSRLDEDLQDCERHTMIMLLVRRQVAPLRRAETGQPNRWTTMAGHPTVPRAMGLEGP
ncbi:hypothetical protein [Micromonospora sp. NPDC004704]